MNAHHHLYLRVYIHWKEVTSNKYALFYNSLRVGYPSLCREPATGVQARRLARGDTRGSPARCTSRTVRYLTSLRFHPTMVHDRWAMDIIEKSKNIKLCDVGIEMYLNTNTIPWHRLVSPKLYSWFQKKILPGSMTCRFLIPTFIRFTSWIGNNHISNIDNGINAKFHKKR